MKPEFLDFFDTQEVKEEVISLLGDVFNWLQRLDGAAAVCSKTS